MNVRHSRSLRAGVLLAAASLALAGCASAAPPAPSGPAADSVTITDGWVKAAETGMTAGFGELRNNSDTDLVVVGADTAASDVLELHETVEDEAGQMIMQEVAAFTVPAGGALTLEPGGDHLMFMGLAAPLLAGDEVTVTLTFDDDSTLSFTAPVKEYSGANESYSDEHANH